MANGLTYEEARNIPYGYGIAWSPEQGWYVPGGEPDITPDIWATPSPTTTPAPIVTPTPTPTIAPPITPTTYTPTGGGGSSYTYYPTTYPTTTIPKTTLGQWSAANAPPTPYWLPQVSPGQVSGQPMKKLPVKTPSGQLWSQFMPSWRGGLESYINYAAGTAGVIASYQDLLAQILSMQPSRSPYRAGQWNTGGVW